MSKSHITFIAIIFLFILTIISYKIVFHCFWQYRPNNCIVLDIDSKDDIQKYLLLPVQPTIYTIPSSIINTAYNELSKIKEKGMSMKLEKQLESIEETCWHKMYPGKIGYGFYYYASRINDDNIVRVYYEGTPDSSENFIWIDLSSYLSMYSEAPLERDTNKSEYTALLKDTYMVGDLYALGTLNSDSINTSIGDISYDSLECDKNTGSNYVEVTLPVCASRGVIFIMIPIDAESLSKYSNYSDIEEYNCEMYTNPSFICW